ncbi:MULTISPECIES: hypothetical protein [unclassified Pseudomonas]|uniref:hypothetical protein n=1 Tax=unclassified Pseudomonas TaxID=196821 RepID=UPI002158A0FE|nr:MULTISPECIES: hypothetical protein [unclassified Pseudomonas]
MVDFAWGYLARLLTKPRIADALIRFAKRTPYLHLRSPDGSVYMERYWVFNPYDRVTNVPRWAPLIPFSIRVHHIRREDLDRHLHSHPWNARTVILKGWYFERRLVDKESGQEVLKWRRPGDTAVLTVDDFHRIAQVSPDGVYALFICGRWRRVWGFLVGSSFVHWRRYLGKEASNG